jgi:hypothetical protein
MRSSSSSHTPPPSTYAGVKCERTTRSSFIHSCGGYWYYILLRTSAHVHIIYTSVYQCWVLAFLGVTLTLACRCAYLPNSFCTVCCRSCTNIRFSLWCIIQLSCCDTTAYASKPSKLLATTTGALALVNVMDYCYKVVTNMLRLCHMTWQQPQPPLLCSFAERPCRLLVIFARGVGCVRSFVGDQCTKACSGPRV